MKKPINFTVSGNEDGRLVIIAEYAKGYLTVAQVEGGSLPIAKLLVNLANSKLERIEISSFLTQMASKLDDLSFSLNDGLLGDYAEEIREKLKDLTSG